MKPSNFRNPIKRLSGAVAEAENAVPETLREIQHSQAARNNLQSELGNLTDLRLRFELELQRIAAAEGRLADEKRRAERVARLRALEALDNEMPRGGNPSAFGNGD